MASNVSVPAKPAKMPRDVASERVRELGYWIAGHASQLTAEMDEMLIERSGITINADIDLDGIKSVKVVKSYILIN